MNSSPGGGGMLVGKKKAAPPLFLVVTGADVACLKEFLRNNSECSSSLDFGFKGDLFKN